MTKVDTSSRFVPEGRAEIAAYLKVMRATLEQAVRPAIPLESTKARNDLDEIRTALDRIGWHLDGANTHAPTNGLDGNAAADEHEYSLRTEIAPADAPRIDIDPAKLQAVLRETMPNAAALTVTEMKLVAGGRSKLTALVAQSGCADLPRDLVFRQDWASAVTGTSVTSEYELLSRIAPLGIRAPQCLHYVAGPNAIGGPFMIVSRLPGSPKGDIFEPPASPRLALQLAGQLAALHAHPAADFSDIAALDERDFTAEQLMVTITKLRQTHNVFGQDIPTIHSAFDWLEQNVPAVAVAKSLVHGDLGFHNFLVDGDELSAVLDWELAHFGNPAEDLGYIRGDIERMLPWADFMAAYRDAGGPVVSASDIDFYFVFGMTRLYCLLMQARAGLKSGLVQDIAVVRVCLDAVPRLVATLAAGLSRITSDSHDS